MKALLGIYTTVLYAQTERVVTFDLSSSLEEVRDKENQKKIRF